MTTAVQVQYRRGTAAQVAAFTGAPGELVVDTTNNRVVVQDGATAGGWPSAGASRVAVSDAAYALSAPYNIVAYTAISAARTVTLCAAANYPTGARLLIVDESGSCSAANAITVARAGSDTIDGAVSAAIKSAYGFAALESNGSNAWTIVDQVGVASLNGLIGAVALAATDGTAVSASGSTLSIGGPGGMVNKFRNGTMDVWQRGTSSLTATTSGTYTADGWIVMPAGASVTAAQAGGRLLTKSSLQVTGAASVTDVQIMQRIESLIAAAFCSQTVTVQAQLYNNTGGSLTPTLTVKRPSTQDGWSGTVNSDVNAVSLQACADGAWTQIAYTFSANAASYNGLELIFDFGNNLGAGTKTVQITECDIRVTPGAAVGLNVNPPPPELRPIALELLFCQRYFFRNSATSAYQPWAIGVSQSSTVWYGIYDWPVPMRTAPTVTLSAYTTFSFAVALTITGISPASTTALNLFIQVQTSGGTSGQGNILDDGGSANSSIQASAEL